MFDFGFGANVSQAMQGFPPWSTSETVSKPLADTRQAVDGVYKVHVHVRWLAAESLVSSYPYKWYCTTRAVHSHAVLVLQTYALSCNAAALTCR